MNAKGGLEHFKAIIMSGLTPPTPENMTQEVTEFIHKIHKYQLTMNNPQNSGL